MLETLDLHRKLGKAEYKREMTRLGEELALLQRAAFENGLPVLVLFEGWEGAGKGDSISRLVDHMDPRGFIVHTTRRPTEDEALRPMLWRFWHRVPGKGEITIFDRSWYWDVTQRRLGDTLDSIGWDRAIDDIKDFERQLADAGVVLLKFWLHISRGEQRRRLKSWARDPYQRWRVEAAKTVGGHKYKDVLRAVEESLALTHTHVAPWILVEAENESFRRVKVLSETAVGIRRALETRGIDPPRAEPARRRKPKHVVHHPDPLKRPPPIPAGSPLARVDLGKRLARPKYERELDAAQDELRELGFACYARRLPVVVLFEGWDASGKGGAIKRLTAKLDPRGYRVIPIAAPKGSEATHHYLWRFWEHVPKAGHIAIFDRSWYGRVLVERVEGFCKEHEWHRAYQEINEFEQALADAGTVIVKFWLHIGLDEQLRRFRRREAIASKNYKIGAEDWRNRAKWPRYVEAVSDMVRQTSTGYAPWTLVEADDKLWARVKVIRTVTTALGAALKGKRKG